MYNTLIRIKSKVREKEIIGFDTETAEQEGGAHTFILGTTYTKNKKYTFYIKEYMQKYLLSQDTNTFIVASNLSFDFNILFYDTPLFYKFKPIDSGGRMISAIYESESHHASYINNEGKEVLYAKKKIYFIDTYNFMQGSVESYGKILGVPKMDKPQLLGQTPINEAEWDYLAQYCSRDSEITYKFMILIQNGLNSAGGTLKITAASSSMDTFRRMYLNQPIRSEERKIQNINKKIYNSYFGGRTEIFSRGFIRNYHYGDFNSLYPSVMRNEFPNPNTMRYASYPTKDVLEYDGVSRVRMEVPEMHVPILPVMTNKLLFPYGIIEGTYTHAELRKAISEGYNLKKLYWSIYYKKNFYPFKEYIEDMYKKRSDLKKAKNPVQLVYKLLMNCFSEDTKIWTTDGLKNISEVNKGDYVYSINPKTLNTEKKKVTKTWKYDYDGEMYRIKSLKYDCLVTPNHNMIVKHRGGKYFRLVEAQYLSDEILPKVSSKIEGSKFLTYELHEYLTSEDIHNDSFYYPNGKKGMQRYGIPLRYYEDDFMRLCGWYISEGSLYRKGENYKVIIHQKKKHNRDIIERLLYGMRILYTKTPVSFEIYDKILYKFFIDKIGKYQKDRTIPKKFFTRDHTILQGLYDSMMDGDGYKGIVSQGKRRQSQKYTTNSKQLAIDFQRLCIHLGLHTKITKEDNIYRIYILQHKYFTMQKDKGQITIEKNNSKNVYCITVKDNHTVLTYRNGKICFTGQSLYGKFAQHNMEEIEYIDIDDEERKKELIDKYPDASFHIPEGSSVGYLVNKTLCTSTFVRPIFSVYTTAYGRIKLWDAIKQYKAIYVDTDSIITKREVEDDSRLGFLKKEMFIKRGILVKPKMYTVLNDEGSEITKIKGIPKPDTDTFEKILERKIIKRMKFSKMRESIRMKIKPNTKYMMEKNVKLEDDKRVWTTNFNPYIFDDYSKPYKVSR